jgi:transposase
MNEFEHMSARVKRLEEAILELVKQVPQAMQELIRGRQALRGIAHISAVTIAAELGNISSRFETARKLMGYSGAFPSEDSSGTAFEKVALPRPATRTSDGSRWNQPGAIDTYPASGKSCVNDIKRFRRRSSKSHGRRRIACTSATGNTMACKDQRKVITAVGRELLGFIWAIAIKAEPISTQPIAA